jgi:SlyX protein
VPRCVFYGRGIHAEHGSITARHLFFCVFPWIPWPECFSLLYVKHTPAHFDKSGKYMNDNELASHMETLEIRLMHQEAAIEELTQTLLQQEQLIRSQGTAIERVESMIHSLSSTHTAPPGDEPPPPHY